MQNLIRLRASQIGQFMSKSGKLTQTGKTESLKMWLKQQYGYDEVLTTEAMSKGIELEDDAIELVQSVLKGERRMSSHARVLRAGKKEYSNNQNAISFGYYNDWIIGSPDIVLSDAIEDIKVSMNLRTFYEAEMTDLYEWQLRAYMWLTGRKYARLIYCAMPDPDWMVHSKINKLKYTLHDEAEIAQYESQILHNSRCVLQMPKEKRIKVFDVVHDELKIEQMESMVAQVREYFVELNKSQL